MATSNGNPIEPFTGNSRNHVLSAHRNDNRGSTVLSVLSKAHAAKKGILGFLPDKTLPQLRLVSPEWKEAVNRVPINHLTTIVKGSLAGWRATFPKAEEINISGRTLTDADFVHLKGLKTVIMARCSGFTGAGFVHLKGIHTLYMSQCRQITGAGFVHLKGIHTLYMSQCSQITDAAFEHLKGIKDLEMSRCSQITDAAFEHLKGIHTLDMSQCRQITDAAFNYLKGIHTLIMYHCSQAGITDAAFAHLKGIKELYMGDCNQEGITDAAFVHLEGIKELDITHCTQPGISDNGSLCHLQQARATIIGKVLNCPGTGGARKHKRTTKKRSKFLKRKSQKRR